MKIIFFSDVHGNRYVIDQFFEDIKAIVYDKLIFGGDIFGYYYEQEYVLSVLKRKNVHCLLGNHDRMFLDLIEGRRSESALVKKYGNSYKNIGTKISKQSINFLYSLQSRYEIETDGLNLGFVHGTVDDPLDGRIYPDTEIENMSGYEKYDFVFAGHTHHKMIKKLRNGCTIINAGSIGQQRDGKGCSYVIFDTIKPSWSFKVCEYSVDRLLRDISEKEELEQMKEKLSEVLVRNSN